jgi:hypothetical protein
MLLARLARVFLAVALLTAWQAALQHPIAHVDELGELVHLHDGHSSDDSEGRTLCDLLASLTACAPDAGPTRATSELAQETLRSIPPSAPRVAEAPPFFSQGPPASV